MLTSELMKQLKQVNVSKNNEKTMERMKTDFSAATTSQKRDIVELSGQNRNSFYRVFRTGAPNARLVLAVSEILNVTPFYYTGETDDRNPTSDEETRRFLIDRGYESKLDLADKPQKKRRKSADGPKTRKTAPEQVETDESNGIDEIELFDEIEDIIELTIELSDSEKMRKAVSELTEDEAVALLKTLFTRARAGGEAEQICDFVLRCLLS